MADAALSVILDPAGERVLRFLEFRTQAHADLDNAEADLGKVLIEAEDEKQEGFDGWLRLVDAAARQRKLRTLDPKTARRYMKVERFRRAAGARFAKVSTSRMRAVMTLPDAELDDFTRNGVPMADGTRVPLEQAPVQRLRDLAKEIRAKLGLSGPTAKSDFEKLVAKLEKMTLTDAQRQKLAAVGKVTLADVAMPGLVLEVVHVSQPEVEPQVPPAAPPVVVDAAPALRGASPMREAGVPVLFDVGHVSQGAEPDAIVPVVPSRREPKPGTSSAA